MSQISRRQILAGSGALVVAFATGDAAAQNTPPAAPRLPGSLADTPGLGGWVRIDPDGAITIFTGKAELGQGLRTALIQVAAEQLDVAPAQIHLVMADTARTPNEGYTAGSYSMHNSGAAILHATAEVRGLLVEAAAGRFGVPAAQLTTSDGRVNAPDGKSLGYGELIGSVSLDRKASFGVAIKDPARNRVIGAPIPRVDIPAKMTGGAAYVQDLRLPGMVHARVVRPPSYGSKLLAVETAAVAAMPGVLKVVRDGSYLAVIASGEYQAVMAMRALQAAAKWSEGTKLPDKSGIFDIIRNLPARDTVILDRTTTAAAPVRTLNAQYRRPYGMHGSIGPSCAVAHLDGDAMTIWSHTQGVYPDRAAIAELVKMPAAQVRCIHTEGSGCYGHNGADDAAADAALLAKAFPGRPVRVQWMREQENTWEPFTPAMVMEAQASLDASGRIVDWDYGVWSNTHNNRPGNGGRLMPSWHIAEPLVPAPPQPIPQPEGGGDRNAVPLYDFPKARAVSHFLPDMPLRVSAMRGLGAYANVFSIESFMDELAQAAGADPVAFRLNHLTDPRARDVVTTAAANFGWDAAIMPAGHGRGFAFARYKNLGAYAAMAVEVSVDAETGEVRLIRADVAIDSGQAVSLDGIRNQTQGGVVQSTSWTLLEEVTYDTTGITSRDWRGYPIIRFNAVPDAVRVHVIDRPGQPYLGTGEAAQGPTAAAIANAVANAVRVRIRELPLSRARVKAALSA